MSLEIKQLNVQIGDKLILQNINLTIEPNDVVLILGPNGHGKSTLLKSIMAHYDTKITSGEIILDGTVINDKTTDEITKLGIYFIMQNPVDIPGLSLIELLRQEANLADKKINVIELYKVVNQKMKTLGLNQELLNRGINENFSGGEKKKSEILQMQILDSNYIMLDEIDSGLDVDAVNVIADILQEQKKQGKSIIYISHNDKLFNTLKPNKTVLIVNGTIHTIGDYEFAKQIYHQGYSKYANEQNIVLNEQEDKFLKHANKEFNCGK